MNATNEITAIIIINIIGDIKSSFSFRGVPREEDPKQLDSQLIASRSEADPLRRVMG
jgi:hypothetical protein